MRVLVSGDRSWGEEDFLFAVLDIMHDNEEIIAIIEGEANGADSMARRWAESNGVLVCAFPADWETYHRAAGPIRNQQMLRDGQPDCVVFFHKDLANSKGTKHMVSIAQKAGVPVIDAWREYRELLSE